MDNYTIINKLGSGSFGDVYKAVDKISGDTVAIKQLKRNHPSNHREVKFLKKLTHPNIIRLRHVIPHDHSYKLTMVFDYMDYNLSQFMAMVRNGSGLSLSQDLIKDWCFQLFLGLSHMHRLGYFHRDLKPDNLLLNNHNVVKIADLGLAREIDQKGTYTEYTTTRWYRAPEVMLTAGRYCPKIDMWAMGTIMAELFNLAPLFPGKTQLDQLCRICDILGKPTLDSSSPDYLECVNNHFASCTGVSLSEVIPSASKDAIDLIQSLLSWDPSKRPTALEALQHPFFGSLYNASIDTSSKLLSSIQPKIESEKKIVITPNNMQFLDTKDEIYIPPVAKRNNDFGVIGRRNQQTLRKADYGVIGRRKQQQHRAMEDYSTYLVAELAL
ncbi:hypothetical protein ACFE04_029248 [Oxalis oulophora]